MEISSVSAANSSAIHSLVLVLWALQMCMVLCHRVQCDAADFTGIAPFQTWEETESHLKRTNTGHEYRPRKHSLLFIRSYSTSSHHYTIISIQNPSSIALLQKHFLHADTFQSYCRWAFSCVFKIATVDRGWWWLSGKNQLELGRQWNVMHFKSQGNKFHSWIWKLVLDTCASFSLFSR